MSEPMRLLWTLARLVAAMATALTVFGRVATAQEVLVISGRIVNRTPDGGAVSGLPVTLHIMGGSGHRDVEEAADGEGRFAFRDPEIIKENDYHVSTRYKGALYGVDVSAAEDGSFFGVEVPVYEATEAADRLAADGWWVILQGVDRENRTLKVLEMFDLRNGGDRTYLAPIERMLQFPLLQGAEGVEATTDMYGRDFVDVGGGLVLATGIPPGEHHVMYGYRIPVGDGGRLTFQHLLPIPAQEAQVLAVPDLRVTSPSLRDLGTAVIEGETLRAFTAGATSGGDALVFTVSGEGFIKDRGFPGIAFFWAGPAPLAASGVAVAGAVTGALLLALRWRRRPGRAKAGP